MLKINFSFQNEFGNETNVMKTFDESFVEDTTEFYFLVDEFKLFLLSCGFAQGTVDKITVED